MLTWNVAAGVLCGFVAMLFSISTFDVGVFAALGIYSVFGSSCLLIVANVRFRMEDADKP